MITENIELDYIYKGDSVVRTLIGGLIILVFESIIVWVLNTEASAFKLIIKITASIIPFVLIVGYIIDIFKYAENNNINPPEFKLKKFKQYIKDGTSGTIIFFFHTSTVFIPLTCLAVIFSSSKTSLFSVFSSYLGNSLTTFLLLMLIVVFISYIYILLTVPASFGIYTHSNSIVSSLSPTKISKITFSREYIIAFLIAIIVSVLVLVSSVIMNVIQSVGLFDVFIKFIALIFTQRTFSVVTDKKLINDK